MVPDEQEGAIEAPTVLEEGYRKRKATRFSIHKKIYDDFLWFRYLVVKEKKRRN